MIKDERFVQKGNKNSIISGKEKRIRESEIVNKMNDDVKRRHNERKIIEFMKEMASSLADFDLGHLKPVD